MANTIQYSATLNTTDFEKGIQVLKSSLDSVERKLSSASASSKSTAKGFNAIGTATKKIASSLKGLNNPLQNTFKGLTRIWRMLRLMVLRTALRKVIEEIGNGFKGLAKYSSEFNSSMSVLSGSSKKLAYSFSAMVAPLVNALAPALQTIIDLCIRAMNAINQLFSAFSGKTTFISAKDQTEDWAKSLDDASGSAKKLKNTVMGFDELNKLNDNSNSGSSSAIDPSSMFETKDISPMIQDWKKKLIDAWNKADFSEIGGIIGRKLKDALDKIPWGNIKKIAGDIGKSIATFINGFVEVDGLGYSIGNTLAQAFNTAFEFLYKFVTNLHWKSIGSFIADSINGAVENIDLKKAGQTLSIAVKGLLDTMITAVNEINWSTIGYKIGEFLGNIDWNGIVAKVANLIGSALKAVPKIVWNATKGYIKSQIALYAEENGESTAQSVITFLKDRLIKKASPAYFLKEVATPIAKALEEALVKKITEVFEKKISAFFDTETWTFRGVKEGFRRTFIDAFNEASAIWNKFARAMNGNWNIAGKTITVSLPVIPQQFKNGGFIEDGLFTMNQGEIAGRFNNGKSVVANNQQITDGIAQAVYRAMVQANGNNNNNSGYINNTITIDGEVIARAVTKGQNSINRRYSPTMA